MTHLTTDRARQLLAEFRSRHVLVIGDVMLDRFIWGEVDRISPEAPVPVVRVNREEGPAFGAALLAAVGVGAYPDLAAAGRATLKRLRPESPKPEAHRAYDEPYRRFQALYPAIKSIRD